MQFKSFVIFAMSALVATSAALPTPEAKNNKAPAKASNAGKAQAAKAAAAKASAAKAKGSASKGSASTAAASTAAASDAGNITTGLPENIQQLVNEGKATCKAAATGDIACTAGTNTFQLTDTGGAGLKGSK